MSFKMQRTLTAVLFLGILLAGLCYLLPGIPRIAYSALVAARNTDTTGEPYLFSLSDRLQAATAQTEQSLTDTLDRDHLFIETHGLMQKLMGRRVVEDADPGNTVARLSNGDLTFVYPLAAYMDPTHRAEALVRFRDQLTEALNIPLLYVQAPGKDSRYGEAALPEGLAGYADEQADTLLAVLGERGVDTLDLRPVFGDTGRYDEFFFSTDHHWTPEGAFLGWQAVADTLESDYGLSPLPASTDPSQWEVTTLEDFFLGSQGKRVGISYAGLDDFELWAPKEVGQYQYTVPIQGTDKTGTFTEAFCFPARLENPDPYLDNPYAYYSGGDYSFARMKNLSNPDGPTVLLIRDSFSCTFAPFMATGFGEVVTIDLRHFHEDLMEYISWVEADLVMVLYNPGAVGTDAMFQFSPPA